MSTKTLRFETDKKYLSRAREGDIDAFGELVRANESFVISVCLASLKDVHLAEDASQETFIKAWRGIKNFKAESSFSTWIFTIAKNVCRDILAKEKTAVELTENVADFSTPENEIIKKDESLRVRRALSMLSSEYKTILILREWQGLSYSEIADVLCLSEGTVKSRISRARASLLEKLREI